MFNIKNMSCFTCHRIGAGFQDVSNALTFCNETCQKTFYINGTFETLLNRSDFDVNVFVYNLKKYDNFVDRLKFINALFEDANEDQKNRISQWLLTDKNVQSSLYDFYVYYSGEKRTIKVIFRTALIFELNSILRFLPLDALTSRKFAQKTLRAAISRTVSIETLRIVMLRFKYTVSEFISYGIDSILSTYQDNSDYFIGVLKLFGTMLNKTGKDITLQFIKMIELGENYLEDSYKFRRHIMQAYINLIKNVNVTIEPKGEIKKIKV